MKRWRMNRTSLSLVLLCLADPALASGVHPGNITPIMIAPVLSAAALALLVGAFVAKDREGAAGWLAGGALLVLMIVLSRLLAGFGYIAAVAPQIICATVLLVSWRKSQGQG
jgi:hypothetical protein